MANSLKEVLEDINNPNQSYCVPGRVIFDNIIYLFIYFDFSKSCGVNFGLISIDQEKVFDLKEHDYLWEVLDVFGFNSGGLCAPF